MRFVKLGDVARIYCGGTLDRSNSSCRNGSIPWVAAKDIRDGRIHDSLERITEFGLKGSGSSLLPVGSLIMPAGMTFESVVITDVPVAINNDLKAIVVESSIIDRNYLQKFLISTACNFGFCQKEGMGNRHVIEILADIDIPFFPIERQRHIALVLDKAGAIAQKTRVAIQLADSFLFSVFFDMFGDSATNPKGWAIRPLKDLAEGFVTSPRNMERQDEVPVTEGGAMDSKDWLVSYSLRSGDVVLSRNGEMGQCLAATKNNGEGWNDTCDWVFRPNPLMVEASYLSRVLSGAFAKASFDKILQSARMQNLNITNIEDFCVPTPPLDLQRRYTQIHTRMISIKENLVSELLYSNSLLKSLAASAFTIGEKD